VSAKSVCDGCRWDGWEPGRKGGYGNNISLGPGVARACRNCINCIRSGRQGKKNNYKAKEG
jgi:hypothetical protein